MVRTLWHKVLTPSTQRSCNKRDLCIGYHLHHNLLNHHQNISRISEDTSRQTINKWSDIFPSFFKVWAHFTASIAPLQIFFNNRIDGKGECFCKILYDCIEVYHNSNANRIILVEYTSLFLNLYSRSSSNKLSNFSVCDIKYAGKFSNILLRVRRQSRSCRKHWGKGTGEPLKNNFACSSLSIWIHSATSGNNISLSTSLKNLTWSSLCWNEYPGGARFSCISLSFLIESSAKNVSYFSSWNICFLGDFLGIDTGEIKLENDELWVT